MAQALELDADGRQAYVDHACAGRAEVYAEVNSLLRASRAAGDFLECPTRILADPPGSLQLPTPERVGPYRLIEEIGHGGMSVVYRAERDDGQYHKQVAVKLLATGWISPESLRRFLAERQILATLEHSHICRLLDGGVTGGVPYLVMDFVDGVPILDYCRQKGLGQGERLQLFRQICAAVQYAHQHLIVHRDIKPGNVLVTREGEVKLLDFGIAKVLAGGASDQTQAGFGAMTPDYASPEQIMGGPVTTQTDVYSLGVLLYELLAGRRPYTASGKRLDEMLAIVNEAEPPRAGLPAELLAIARHALAKDPHDRYPSVSAFDDDVERYLSGQPVLAVAPSSWYRVRKWIGRHRLPVFAGAAAAILIIGALGFALRSAAEAHREQVLAEQRFQEVRRLADKVLFDYPFALRQITASTELQLRMANDSFQYLDELARARSSDPDMLLELAKGYIQIGIVLGTPRTGNLGHPDKSLEAFTKAQHILEDLLRRRPDLPPARRELASLLRRISQLNNGHGRELAERSLALWQDVYRQQPEADDLFHLGWTHVRLAELELQSDHARQAIELFQKYLALKPGSVNGIHQQAYAHRLLARGLLERKDTEGALAASQNAKSLDERARSLLANNAAYPMEISIDLQMMATAYLLEDHLAAARKLFQHVADVRRKVFQSNRNDEWIQQQFLDALNWLGWSAERQRDWAGAHSTYSEAVKLAPTLSAVQPTEEWNIALGFAYGSEGLLLERAGRRAEGCALIRRSAGYFRGIHSFESPNFQSRAAQIERAEAVCLR